MPQLIDGGRGDRHGAAGGNGTAAGWPDGVDTVLPGSASVVARAVAPGETTIRDQQLRGVHQAFDLEIAGLLASARTLRGDIAETVAASTAPDGVTTRHAYQAQQVAVEARRAEAAARALVLRLGEWTTARDRAAR